MLDRISEYIFEQPASKTGEMALLYFMIHGTSFAFYGAFFYTLYKAVRFSI